MLSGELLVLAVVLLVTGLFLVMSRVFNTSDTRSGLHGWPGNEYDSWWEEYNENCQKKCQNCGKETLRRCGRCRAVKYCSVDCQREDWNRGHKRQCSALAKMQPKLENRCEEEEAPVPIIVLSDYSEFLRLARTRGICVSPPCGLVNCGNSCFANALLQCLAYTRPLAAYFLQRKHQKSCKKPTSASWCLMCEVEELVNIIHGKGDPSFASARPILAEIRKLTKELTFGNQEDSHELYMFFLDNMAAIMLAECGGKSLYDFRTAETTLIHHIFHSYTRAETICTKCRYTSRKYETNSVFMIEVTSPAVESLETALYSHFKAEQLDDDNKYKCEKCKQLVNAHRQTKLETAPNMLAITLKRYGQGRYGKITRKITYPDRLDLTPHMASDCMDSQPYTYTLCSVVVHLDQLNSTSSGHYVSYIRADDGCWYLCNDSNVTKVASARAMDNHTNMYMVLYSRDVPRSAPNPNFRRPNTTAQKAEGQAPLPTVSSGVETLSRVATAPAALVKLHSSAEATSEHWEGTRDSNSGGMDWVSQEDSADVPSTSSHAASTAQDLSHSQQARSVITPEFHMSEDRDNSTLRISVKLDKTVQAREIGLTVQRNHLSLTVPNKYHLSTELGGGQYAVPERCKFRRKSGTLRILLQRVDSTACSGTLEPGPIYSTDNSGSDGECCADSSRATPMHVSMSETDMYAMDAATPSQLHHSARANGDVRPEPCSDEASASRFEATATAAGVSHIDAFVECASSNCRPAAGAARFGMQPKLLEPHALKHCSCGIAPVQPTTACEFCHSCGNMHAMEPLLGSAVIASGAAGAANAPTESAAKQSKVLAVPSSTSGPIGADASHKRKASQGSRNKKGRHK